MRSVRTRWLVPEVIQTSAMDCGPASLKAVLEGFGVRASYGRLREACMTSVDGTSIDTVEDLLTDLGFEAEQVMLPTDHLLIEEVEAFPALILVRRPNGAAHFIVAWRRVGPLVQIMDPAVGRRWVRKSVFRRDLFVHTMPVAASQWYEWAGSEDFLGPFRSRLESLGVSDEKSRELIAAAFRSGSPTPVAQLDATVRYVAALCGSLAVRRGREATMLTESLVSAPSRAEDHDQEIVPEAFFSVRPSPEDDDKVLLTGAVLVRIRGRKADTEEVNREGLSDDLRTALSEPIIRPGLEFARRLFDGNWSVALLVLAALVASAGSVILEGLFFRGLIDGGRFLGLEGQRVAMVLSLCLVLGVRVALKVSIAAHALKLGRRFEIGLRIAFFEKIPRLADRYFRSRLSSDMAERAHVVHALHRLPTLGFQVAESVLILLALTAGIIWLAPEGAWRVVLAACVSLVIPFAVQEILAERDLRVRTHAGGLTRFSLDTLLGLAPIRCHRAERPVARTHEALVVQWSTARRSLLAAGISAEALLAFCGYGLMVWLLWGHVVEQKDAGAVLLLVYWGLQIPALGMRISALARQYPQRRNIFLRLLEPLMAPDRKRDGGMAPPGATEAPTPPGVEIEMAGVEVWGGGRTILAVEGLIVRPGEHIAVVGPSGAGKSTLVGLLLGWHEPWRGSIHLDGDLLDSSTLERLRPFTAWVDPEVRLWNASLNANLRFGNPESGGLAEVLDITGLMPILEDRALGLKMPLGEGGARLSGGEGQRVRLARAMLRDGVRLAILDEAFRSFHRPERRRLLGEARRHWAKSTLLHVTHDLEESLDFDRVLVLERGRIVQDGAPEDLVASSGVFARRLKIQRAADRRLWEDPAWRRLLLTEDGLSEVGQNSSAL